MVCIEPLTELKCNENVTKEPNLSSTNINSPSVLPKLWVHIMENCTTQIHKKPVSLKNALQLKMKNLKLEIDKSVAFVKDTNTKIDWEFRCDEILVDRIEIKEAEFIEVETKTLVSTEQLDIANMPVNIPSFRVHIDRYTAVIQKKPILLKDALRVKLKTRNLEIENSVAFIRDTNVKIDWECKCDEILVDSITVREKGQDIEHSFGRLSLSLKTRACDSCKKKTTLRLRACKKCNYSICDKVECLNESSNLICKSKRRTSLTNSLSIFSFGKNMASGSMGGEADLSMSFNGWDLIDYSNSEQILPVTEIKPCFSYRMRSSSDSEIKASPVNNPNKDINNNTTNNKTGTLDSKLRLRNKKPKSKKSSQRNISIISCEIPMHQIKVEEGEGSQIGKGSFGTVKKAQEFYHGLVAIKYLNISKPSPNQVTAFRNEMAILKSTRHDNILQYIGCQMKPQLAIVTEFCPGSSLYRHIHQDEEHMEMHDLVEISKQTAMGMDYLHARGILHRDLKSNNIFLVRKESSVSTTWPYVASYLGESGSQWKVKIGDFGLATIESAKSKQKSNNPSGSILWMAPEVITQKLEDPYSTKSDVYSFAVVVYELVTSLLPFRNKEQNMIFFQVGIGRLKLIPDDVTRPAEARAETPIELLDLIKTCSKYNRDERLEFDQIGEILGTIRIEPVPEKPKRKRTISLPNVDRKRPSDLFANYIRHEIENLTAVDQLDEFDPDLDRSPLELDNNSRLMNYF